MTRITTARSTSRPTTIEPQALFARILNWLVRIDYAHRQHHHLKNLDDALLDDMGLTRDQIDDYRV